MKKMRWDFTLPEFQEKLDGLADGTLFQISGRDCERLFGTNDVAVARLRISQEAMPALSAIPTAASCSASNSRSTRTGFDLRQRLFCFGF